MTSPNFHLRLPPELRREWEKAADREGRTLSNWIKAVCTAEARLIRHSPSFDPARRKRKS